MPTTGRPSSEDVFDGTVVIKLAITNTHTHNLPQLIQLDGKPKCHPNGQGWVSISSSSSEDSRGTSRVEDSEHTHTQPGNELTAEEERQPRQKRPK